MGYIAEFTYAMEAVLNDPFLIALEVNTRNDEANKTENNPNRESTNNNVKQGEGGNATDKPESEKTQSQNDALDSNQAKKSRIQTFLAAVRKIFLECINQIEKFLVNLHNSSKKIMITHNEFMNTYSRMKARYKPQKSVVITNYKYDNKILDNVKNSLLRVMNDSLRDADKLIRQIGTDAFMESNSYLFLSGNELELMIVKAIDSSSNAPSVNSCFSEIRNKYRGEKKTISMGIADLTEAEQFLSRYQELMKNTDNDTSKVKNTVSTYSNMIERTIQSNSITDAERKKLVLISKNLVRISDALISFIGYRDTLATEKYFSSRYIVKKFYRF